MLDEFYKLKNKANQIFQKCPLIASNNKNNVVLKLDNPISWDITYEGWVSPLTYDYTTCMRSTVDYMHDVYDFN